MNDLYKILGYAGALPFLACAAGLVFIHDSTFIDTLALLQLIYAAMIASFLGGVHWSHALPRRDKAQMVLAMGPTIVSFGVILLPFMTGGYGVAYGIMAVLFLALYAADRRYLQQDWLPAGYMRFRAVITAVVFAALMISLFYV